MFKQFSKHLSAERAVHATMVIFALASVTNIKAFFISAGHDDFAAWSIGGALGLVLVSASIMLSKIDYEAERSTFWLVAAITGAIAVLSGTIQTLAYAEHINSRLVAALLGYGLPVCGEMLLAVAVSMFDLAHRRQLIREVGSTTERQIAAAIGEALADVDVSKVRRYAERQVDAIVRSQVDRIAATYLHAEDTQTATVEPKQLEQPTAPKSAESSKLSADVEQMNEARRAKIAQRRDTILSTLAQHGTMGTGEIAQAVGATANTVRDDLKALADHVFSPSRGKWRLIEETLIHVPELPQTLKVEPTSLHINGVAA